MKLKIKKDDFLRGLRLASGVADRKGTVQILSSTLLRAERDVLLIGATDLTVSVLAALPATIEKHGDIAVTARQLHDVVKELPGDDVSVSSDADKHRLVLRAGRAEFVLPGSAGSDFPKLPGIVADAAQMDATILRELLERTAFSISSDDTRQHLASVLFESAEGKAICVSTDGHRLTKIGREMPTAPDWSGMLIPRKGVGEILRLLEGREAPVGVSRTGGTFAVRADDIRLWVKLTDGQFPPWEQIVPTDSSRRATVSRTALLESLARVTLMSTKDHGVAITLTKKGLVIEATHPEAGDAKEELDAVTMTTNRSEEGKVGVNALYLRDWLSAASSEQIFLDMPGDLDPVVLRPADGSDYIGVVMPMRL